MSQLADRVGLFFKGAAMGAANVIPGVSGGTIAFITGIYETLIDALKSFDLKALVLLKKMEIAKLWNHVNGTFLLVLLSGVAISLLTLAKVLDWLYRDYPEFVWAFFFGLILASTWSVGRMVRSWSMTTLACLILGTAIAVSLAFLPRAQESDNFLYLVVCGMVAGCSMLVPGLSGSFVLILMGNYKLIMIDAINEKNFYVIGAVGFGAALGFVALSHFLSWVFHHFHDIAVAFIAGFIVGSLVIIWPWKDSVLLTDSKGALMLDRHGEEIVKGYQNWHLPDFALGGTWAALGFLVLGAIVVLIIDRLGSAKVSSAPAAE